MFEREESTQPGMIDIIIGFSEEMRKSYEMMYVQQGKVMYKVKM